MNTLEDRLTRDLQSTDRAIEVSDTDVLHAEHRYLRRRHELSHRAHSRTALIAAAAAVTVVTGGALMLQGMGDPVVAPASPDPAEPHPAAQALPLTTDNLAGIWMTGDGWVWAWSTNGEVLWDQPTRVVVGEINTGEEAVPYEITSTGLTLPSENCDFAATLDSAGILRLTVTHTNCGLRVGEFWDHVKVSPAADGMASLAWSADPSEQQTSRVNGFGQLNGTWLKEGTGQLLIIYFDLETKEANYRLDDDGELFHHPDDEGRARLDASGALVLASSAGSDACGGLGSSAVLTELSLTHGNVNTPFGTALEIGGANGIELDRTVGGCSLHDDLAGTWIRVS